MEELCPVHAARVQDDICALWHPVTFDDVIRQGSPHGEVHHRVEAQALVDETLQHLQLLKVPILHLSVTFKERQKSCFITRSWDIPQLTESNELRKLFEINVRKNN